MYTMFMKQCAFWADQLNKSMEFWTEMSNPPVKKEWTTKNTIKLKLGNTNLRDFSTGKCDNPILIVDPQAGHMNVSDYGPDQSLAEAALKSGISEVYAEEWKSCTFDRRNEGIDDFIISMKKSIEAIGKPVTLIGLCQGGWQSAIYTALYPEHVKKLVLAGAPIDFHACDSKIGAYAKYTPMSVYETAVMMQGGLIRGEYMVSAFKALNPVDRYFIDPLNLWLDICNKDENAKRSAITRKRNFRNWYEFGVQNIPGKFYLEAVRMFKDNTLVKGDMIICGRKVDLSTITCPLYLIAGEKDDISPAPQLFNMEKYVNSKEVFKLMVPAGHIGVFMGKKIIQNYWPSIFSQVSPLNS